MCVESIKSGARFLRVCQPSFERLETGVMGATVDQGNLDVPAGAGNVEVKPVLFRVPAFFISRKPFLWLL